MGHVIINADDYAMDAEIDSAIVDLARRGRVTAASAMVLSPAWPEAAAVLNECPISRGLHLDLTSGFANRAFARFRLPGLILRARAGQLDRRRVREEIENQIGLFERHATGAPDFIDGHQHVHHLPVIRDILLETLARRYGSRSSRVGLRICVSRSWHGLKAAIIGGTGAYGLLDRARMRKHTVNTDFAGAYAFDPNASLETLWRKWLAGLQDDLPLVMCHVAKRSPHPPHGDPIRQARYREYDWLSSEAFPALLRQLSITPVPWPQALAGEAVPA